MEERSKQSGKKHYLFYSCKKRKFFHGSETNSKTNDRRGAKLSKTLQIHHPSSGSG
jgi:hypothetical protein